MNRHKTFKPDARIKVSPATKEVTAERIDAGENREQVAADYGITSRHADRVAAQIAKADAKIKADKKAARAAKKALASAADADRSALVVDDTTRETDQDRGEDRSSLSIRDVSDGGSGDSSQAVPDDSATDRSAENEKSVTRAGMTPCLVAESLLLKANAGTVRFQTRFAAFLVTKSQLRCAKKTQ